MNPSYTEKRKINTYVKIHPKDQFDIHKAIQMELTGLIGKCTCKDGYILNIEDIEIPKKITSFKISDCGAWIIVPTSYFLYSYKPQGGQIIDVNVTNIIPGGIIFNYMGCFSVFSTDKKTGIDFQIGDRAKVNITDVRFKNQKYDGLCQIIEKYVTNIV